MSINQLSEQLVTGERWAANDAYSPRLLRQLADASLSRIPVWRFPMPAEADFQRDARLQANGSRRAMSLLAAMLLLVAPHVVTSPIPALSTMLIWSLVAGWGMALAALVIWPTQRWGGIATAVAGAATVAALSLKSPAAPTWSLAALIFLLVMGRFRGLAGLGLAGVYCLGTVAFSSMVAVSAQGLMVGATLVVVLMGGYWSEMAHRRAWAAQRVLRLSAANDVLTGLLNRQAFEAYYQRLALHARRQNTGMTVALLSLDLLQAYRDREGQAAAEQATNMLGRLLRDSARRALDVAARVSETHFVLVLFDCPATPGLLRLDHLRLAVEGLEIRHPVAPSGLLTMSAGAVYADAAMPLSTVLEAADHELQRAQRLGHNRVRMGGYSSGLQAAGQAWAVALPENSSSAVS